MQGLGYCGRFRHHEGYLEASLRLYKPPELCPNNGLNPNPISCLELRQAPISSAPVNRRWSSWDSVSPKGPSFVVGAPFFEMKIAS